MIRYKRLKSLGALQVLLIITFVLLPGEFHPAFSQTDPFAFSVSAFPDEVAPGQQLIIEVKISIASKYQLYAEKTYLEPADITGLTYGKVKNTAAVEKKFPYGEIYKVYQNTAVFKLPVVVSQTAEAGVKSVPLLMHYQGCYDSSCFLPARKDLNAVFTVLPADAVPFSDKKELIQSQDKPVTAESEKLRNVSEKFGFIGILAMAFIWGILASLTPCVYLARLNGHPTGTHASHPPQKPGLARGWRTHSAHSAGNRRGVVLLLYVLMGGGRLCPYIDDNRRQAN